MAIELESHTYPESRPARWPWIVGFVLSIAGLGLSAYLTYEHYTGSTSLTCPANPHSVINCLKVTTSPWSVQWGIPVAVLGLVFFATMLPLQSPWAWRAQSLPLRLTRIGWSIVGLVSAFRLLYFELYRVYAICEWCTAVHIVTFLLFVTTLLGTEFTRTYPDE